MRFGSVFIPLSGINISSVPNELDNGNLSLTYTGDNTSISLSILTALLLAIDFDNGDDFTNYEIAQPTATGILVNYRV